MTADVVWVVRHARRRDFDDPRWATGARRLHDPPLSETGRAQARELARSLALHDVSHLVSSPFLRCVETAAPLSERLSLPIALEPGLSEWMNRAWFPEPPELHPLEELVRRFPRIDAAWTPRGCARHGESGEEALERSGRVARMLAEELSGAVVLVGHGASTLGATCALLRVHSAAAPELDYGWTLALRRLPLGWVLDRGPLPPGFAGAPS